MNNLLSFIPATRSLSTVAIIDAAAPQSMTCPSCDRCEHLDTAEEPPPSYGSLLPGRPKEAPTDSDTFTTVSSAQCRDDEPFRERAQIVDNIRKNSFACPWNFEQQNGVLESFVFIFYYYYYYKNYYRQRENKIVESILRKPVWATNHSFCFYKKKY
jgi:hypothetical protein